MDILPKSLTRDNYFKDYQNLIGAVLSNVASIFDGILHDEEEPLKRDVILNKLSASMKLLCHLFFLITTARKAFLISKYEERVQKILRIIEPTTHLFGDNRKGVIDASKAMEKVSKDLKPRTTPHLHRKTSLNWKGHSTQKEMGRGSPRRPTTS